MTEHIFLVVCRSDKWFSSDDSEISEDDENKHISFYWQFKDSYEKRKIEKMSMIKNSQLILQVDRTNLHIRHDPNEIVSQLLNVKDMIGTDSEDETSDVLRSSDEKPQVSVIRAMTYIESIDSDSDDNVNTNYIESLDKQIKRFKDERPMNQNKIQFETNDVNNNQIIENDVLTTDLHNVLFINNVQTVQDMINRDIKNTNTSLDVEEKYDIGQVDQCDRENQSSVIDRNGQEISSDSPHNNECLSVTAEDTCTISESVNDDDTDTKKSDHHICHDNSKKTDADTLTQSDNHESKPKHVDKPNNHESKPKHVDKPNNHESKPKHVDKPNHHVITTKHVDKPNNHVIKPNNQKYRPMAMSFTKNTHDNNSGVLSHLKLKSKKHMSIILDISLTCTVLYMYMICSIIKHFLTIDFIRICHRIIGVPEFVMIRLPKKYVVVLRHTIHNKY
jgi:hypothetical protein